MARERQRGLEPEQRAQLLKLLEQQGEEKWQKRWQGHIAFPQGINPFSPEKEEQERALRYLLLRAIINQQAQADKARELSQSLFSQFGDDLLFNPSQIPGEKLFTTFRRVGGERGREIYRVGAIGGIKPISLFAYRFKAYEEFIKWLGEKSLRDMLIKYLQQEEGVLTLFDFLSKQEILEAGWVGDDPKACRMLVDWITFLMLKVWGEPLPITMYKTLMLVDGHVGKVFCRTGLLETIIYESKRPYIIQAKNLRPQIETLVSEHNLIPFYVDNGAFYLYEDGFCLERSPKCEECPLTPLCLKYIKWTGYQKWK